MIEKIMEKTMAQNAHRKESSLMRKKGNKFEKTSNYRMIEKMMKKRMAQTAQRNSKRLARKRPNTENKFNRPRKTEFEILLRVLELFATYFVFFTQKVIEMKNYLIWQMFYLYG